MKMPFQKAPEAAGPQTITQSPVGRTLRLQDIANFFKYDMNPAYVDAKMTAMANREKKKQGGMGNMGVIVILAVFVLLACIGYSIVNGSLANNDCVKQLANIAASNAGNVVTAATQTGIK
jgi:cytochrome b